MKVIDLSARYKELADVEDSPNDYIYWKHLIHDKKFTHVLIDGKLFEISKWGPINEITIEVYNG